MYVDSLPFEPHAGQLRVLSSRKRFVVILSGVRGGKSYTAAAAFIRRIFEDVKNGKAATNVPATGSRHRRPRYHAWCVAPTYDLLKEPRRYILQLLEGKGLIEEFYEGRELWLTGGILIEFKSTDNAKALVSAGLNALWVDEADRVDSDAWRGQLRTRLSDKQGWAIFSSTPYAARNGYLYQDLISKKDDPELSEQIDFISWKFIDNPTNTISEYRFAKASIPPRYFKREYEASLDAFVGLIYELDTKKHVIDVLPDKRMFRSVVAGVDWGFVDPGSIVVVGDTGKQLIVVETLKEPHLQVISQNPGERSWASEAVRLQAKWNISQFYCDHEPGFIHAFMRAGLPATNATKDINLGIRRVSESLMMLPSQGSASPMPGLVIHRDCKPLIEELGNMAWQVDKHGNMLEEPEDGNDHAADALRYAVMGARRFSESGSRVKSQSIVRR